MAHVVHRGKCITQAVTAFSRIRLTVLDAYLIMDDRNCPLPELTPFPTIVILRVQN